MKAKLKFTPEEVILTDAQENLAALFKSARAAVRAAEKTCDALSGICTHVFSPRMSASLQALLNSSDQRDWTLQSKYDRATCDICQLDFGWRCPDSPDTVCHYDMTDGLVELTDGSMHQASDEITDRFGNEHSDRDCCIFCNAPEERK
jgi:hypothetical protein